jgi:NAD(P)-dependent dehydrogenase (short-subunit alcohol dehydrogenase family)
MTLANKVVLVVAVGTGLGSAVVSLLASEGATVIGVARSDTTLEAIRSHAKQRGWKFSGQVADVEVQRDVDRVVGGVLQEYGRIDAASINVGHWHPGEGLLHRMSDEEWEAGIRRNLDPVFRVARAVIPSMIDHGGGSVVFVSAALAVRWAGSASYCAAKGGLADLVPKLARDYRVWGVRFNAVLPGSMGHDIPLDPPSADRPIPLTETTSTSPWEVARAVRYLISDESRWVTGSLVTVDGGASTGGAEPTAKGPRP